jgi:hypothetical protein
MLADQVFCDEHRAGAVSVQTTMDTPTLSSQNLTIHNTLTSDVMTLTDASIDSLSIPSLTVHSITLADVSADTTTATTLTTSDSTTDTLTTNQISASTVNCTASLNATNMDTTGNITVSNVPGPYYTAPGEGTYRGIAFFNDVDVGIQSTTTLISANMTSVGTEAYFQGYNTHLGTLDTGTTLGGSKALLALCNPAGTALRYQEDGNIAIYHGGTKVWQNGSAVSDARLKDNVIPLTSAMDKIRRLDGVTFNYNFGKKEKSCGIILEQAREVYPECVVDDELVHLERLVPLLVEGMKELYAREALIKAKK